MDQFKKKQVAIIGGGAAGFFSALSLAEQNPKIGIHLFEKGRAWLTKVKISGGGRCNVTHQCFDPKTLSEHYPRGAKELRAAFHTWQAKDTLEWFKNRGIAIHAEADGRMFPESNDSQTIIDCFLLEAKKQALILRKNQGVESLDLQSDGRFLLKLGTHTYESFDAVCLALGSLKTGSLSLGQSIQKMGHHIEPLAPSLFAFNVSDARLSSLSGVSVPKARVWIDSVKQSQSGPLLITHRGLSGPAILKLSAWEARSLKERGYHFKFYINWIGAVSSVQASEILASQRKTKGTRYIKNTPLFELPKRLWESLVSYAGISDKQTWSQVSKQALLSLLTELTEGCYTAQGKTTNKDEFVTCGGVSRKEINFKRMESTFVSNLYFAGECIDIDGITGGFNFQAAWTTGRIAGTAMAQI